MGVIGVTRRARERLGDANITVKRAGARPDLDGPNRS
jgi:hypothetical protein